MKRKNLLFALLLAIGLPWAANAQTVTIGTGTSAQNSAPIANYYNYSMAEMIFTADEIGTIDVNTILSLGFQCTTNVSKNYGVTVYMKNIEADAFTATTDFITLSATDVVFTGTVSPTSGWTTIDLPTPFTYNRTGNLLIAVNKTSGGYDGYTSIWNYTSTSSYKMLYAQNDANPGVYDPTTALSLSLNYNRPNVQLVFGAPASTPKPTGLAVSGITHNEATLSWTENGTATSWQYCLNGDEEHPVTMNTNPYTLTGLTTLTSYTVKVRSVGTGEYSDWSNEVSFNTTAQATAVGDGWADDFEGTSCGWELINGTLTNAWAWGTAASNGGTHGLYISNDNGTTNAYSHSAAIVFATKLLGFTEGKFEFSYDWNANGESTYDYLRVALVPASVTLTAGTMPSGFSSSALPSGWIALDGGSKLNLVTAWQSKSLAINVTAGNYYLVMAWRNDGSGGTQPPAAVDNVSITRMACPYDVTDLAVSNIATTTADITWTAGEAEEWQVATKAGNGEWTILPNTYTTNSATLTGLTAATTYQVRVRAYCNANDQGTWCDAITFTTECDVIDLALVDYSENFDSYTTTTGFLPICWSRINEGTSYTNYPYVSNSSVNAHSASNYLYFYTYGTSGSDQYAILPEMENMEGKQITLWAKGYNAGNTFKIGMMTDPADATTFEEIAEQTLTTSYEEYSFILGRGNYVAIMMETPTSSTTKGVYIDDITIADVPTCVKPTDLVFVSATTTTATLSWTNGADTQNAWQIAYSTDATFNPDEVTPVDVTANPGTISGLTAATTYYAYVRANCGNDGYSDWSNAYVQFATACEAITDFPVSYNFETSEGFPANASTPTTNQLGACWRNEATVQNGTNATRVWGTSTSYKHEGSQALILPDKGNSTNFAKTMLVFPEMVFTSERGYTVSFWINRNGTNSSTANPEGFKVYISDTDTISANAVELGHYSRNYGIAYPVIESAAGWYQYEIQIPRSTMTGNVFLIFEGQSYYGNATYVDEVLVKETPTCQTPSGLALVSSTTTSATLGWTAGGTETAWQIAYSTDPAFDPDEVTPTNVTSNPGIISGLTASTTYYAYVRANCGNDDYSDWSSAYVQFDTECEVIVVDATHPFTEGFDGITSGIPVCWDNSEGTTTDESYKWNYYATGQNGHCLRFNSYSNSENNTNFLKTPVMVLPSEGDNLQLSFWYKNPAGGDFSVFISTDGGDTYTTALASDLTDQSEWTNEVISLSEYAGNENVVIVFAGTSNWGYGDAYIYLDEVFVGMPFTKHIIGYNSAEGNGNNYYLIASPLAAEVAPTTVDGMITDEYGTDVNPETSTYDLYSFDEAEDLEWQNYRAASNFNLVNGQGYLYASKNGTDLTFIGAPYSGDTKEVTLQMTENENADFQGWNLVGNPFTDLAYIDRPFYRMDPTGTRVLAEPQDGAIQVMEGVFVIATVDEEHMAFNTVAPNNDNKGLVLNLSQGRGNTIDRAIVGIGQGRTLPKFMFNPNDTKLYIPQNGKDYAVVRGRVSDEVPVNFLPTEDGYYNISVDVRNMNLRSLVLKDKVRNVSIDLLRTPNYMFKASAYDRADRFVLSFKNGNGIFKEKLVKGANPEDFSFYSNGVFVIDNEGEANLQVIDMNGRVLSSENIYGSTSITVDAAPGIYLLRLTNGDNVKVQKVVVE